MSPSGERRLSLQGDIRKYRSNVQVGVQPLTRSKS